MTELELDRLLYAAQRRPLAEYGRPTVKKEPTEVKRKRDTWKPLPLTFGGIDDAMEQARQRLTKNPALVARLERLGRERALIYKVLVLTGLRKGELASLTIGQLHLDGPTPCVELAAGDEKNRLGSQIALRSDLVADLASWIAGMKERGRRQTGGQDEQVCLRMTAVPNLASETPLFTVPAGLIRILDRDLAAAGIAKRDERGRTLDVHALRHSFGTLLSVGGVAPRTAQAAMRHSSINLTMNTYTDPKLLDVAGALESLPALPLDAERPRNRESVRATGTDDLSPSKFAPAFAPTRAIRGHTPSSADQTTREEELQLTTHTIVVSDSADNEKRSLSLADNERQENRGDMIRTCDFQLPKLALYQAELRPAIPDYLNNWLPRGISHPGRPSPPGPH
jgi:integrase